MLKNNKILLIHCGGTLGMVQTGVGFGVKRDNLFELLFNSHLLNYKSKHIKITDISVNKQLLANQSENYLDKSKVDKYKALMNSYIIYNYDFMISHNGKQIIYNLLEMKEIIDSSLADLNYWFSVLKIIDAYKRKYIGFVIVHGTDTLSYAASFFYYMSRNIKIVCTGAVEPMMRKQKEGEQNIFNSLIHVEKVEEVSVCFGNYIMPGNRSQKIETNIYNAFWSNKMKFLEEGLIFNKYEEIDDFNRSYKIIEREICEPQAKTSKSIENQYIFTKFNQNIGLIKIFPGIKIAMFSAFFDSCDAIIIETFGCGNGLINNISILNAIQHYAKHKFIINVSQCLNGEINESYEVNNKLARLGVISGGILKTEAMFCLLSWALCNFNYDDAKKEILEQIKKESSG